MIQYLWVPNAINQNNDLKVLIIKDEDSWGNESDSTELIETKDENKL